MENIFDTKADDASLQSKGGGSFGLNKGRITKFEVNPNAGKDGAAQDAVDLDVTVGDREFRSRHFLNLAVYDNKNKLLNPGEPGHQEAFVAHYSQVIGVIKHALGALGVTEQAMSTATAGLTSKDLIEGVKKLVALAPANCSTIPVDVFLEYQWSIPEGKDRTYLQLPRNMKGGRFLSPSVPGTWEEVKAEDGSLSYINKEGQKHPFTKDAGFMGSNKAIPQGNIGGSGGTTSAPTNSPFGNPTAPATSDWD